METSQLLSLLVQRLRGHVTDLQALWNSDQLLPEAVRRHAQAGDVVALNHQLADARRLSNTKPAATLHTTGWADDTATTILPPMPPILFAIHGQLADDLRFLRRLAGYGRQRLLDVWQPQPMQQPRHTYECPVPGAPDVSCRVSSRWMVRWREAFRTMFPVRYVELSSGSGATAAAAAPPAPAVVVVQSRLLFVGH